MWMQAASATIGAFASYRADKAQAKAQRAMQEYRNKMTNIANAINQNAITTNTTLAIQQSARQAVHMRRDELSTLGSTAVAAAAAGVKGNSVNATMLDVQRNAGLLEKQRSQDLEQYFLQEKQQRLSSTLSAVQGQDLTHIPKPRLSTYLMKAAVGTSFSSTGSSGGGSMFSGQGAFSANSLNMATGGNNFGSSIQGTPWR